jgi:hypothetical protein
MPPQARTFRVIAFVEKRDGASCETLRQNEIRRSMFERGLIDDLERFWRVTCELAEINHATPRLEFHGERPRPVCMRVPPYEPDELPAAERAASILEALRKMTQR